MLRSPANSGPDRRGVSGQPGEGGLLAAPVAGAVMGTDPGFSSWSEASIGSGGCFARPLPLDGTCASAARRLFRESVAGLSLPADLLHDGVTMVSELAANTLHAQGKVEFSGSRQRPVSGMPELWVYLRGQGAGCELVCKVFDSGPSWRDDQPRPGMAAPDSVSGRGLQVVAELSGGRWGTQPTRGRLGSWKVPGKAVWFALRVPAAAGLRPGRGELADAGGVDDLEAMIVDRGLGARMVRVDDPAAPVSVLSISRYLTVWRSGDTVTWRTPAGGYQRAQLSDLVEAAEQIVCAHEELARSPDGR